MATLEKTMITVATTIDAPVEKVWTYFSNPNHIVRWNYASDDWHTTRAENDLRTGGQFRSRMESKDGTQGFDFSGKYSKVILNKQIFYTLDDGREVNINFESAGNKTILTESFEPEPVNSREMQQEGWQAILNNFKKYVETGGTPNNLHFEILIQAKPEKVYKILIGDKTYSQWTSAFNPTSHFEGSWEKGSRIKFVGNDQDGNTGGMVGRIKDNNPGHFISIEYDCLVVHGKEITDGPEVDKIKGGFENYTFREENGHTLLNIDTGAREEFNRQYKDYFMATWPEALKKLKLLCEEK